MSHESSTKIDGAARRDPAERKVPKKAFGVVLKEVKVAPRLLPDKPQLRPGALGSVVSGIPDLRTAGTSASLSIARATMAVESSRMVQARAEGLNVQEERLTGRLLDLVVKELSIEFAAESEPRSPTAPQPGAAPRSEPEPQRGPKPDAPAQPTAMKSDGASGQPAPPAARAQAAVELVRRIELFLKSDRPALALTVSGALSARVEVERTGAGQVALRIQGSKGPPPPEDVSRIRDALHARGLKVSSLSVA